MGAGTRSSGASRRPARRGGSPYRRPREHFKGPEVVLRIDFSRGPGGDDAHTDDYGTSVPAKSHEDSISSLTFQLGLRESPVKPGQLPLGGDHPFAAHGRSRTNFRVAVRPSAVSVAK